MTFQPGQRSSRGGTPLWQKVTGVFAVLCLVTCGGIGFWVYRAISPVFELATNVIDDTAGSHEAALTFLESVRTDQLDEAYGLTTDRFRAQNSFEEFADKIRRQETLQQFGPILEADLTFFVEDLQTRVFAYPLGTVGDEQRFAELIVVADQQTYLVDEFDVVLRNKNGELPEEAAVIGQSDRGPGSGGES